MEGAIHTDKNWIDKLKFEINDLELWKLERTVEFE